MTDRIRAAARLDGTSETGLPWVQIMQGGPYLGQRYVMLTEQPVPSVGLIVVEFTPGDQFCRRVVEPDVDVWVRDGQRWAIEESDLPLDSALEAARELLLLGYEVRLVPVVEEETPNE